jgi:hypothetical protein
VVTAARRIFEWMLATTTRPPFPAAPDLDRYTLHQNRSATA